MSDSLTLPIKQMALEQRPREKMLRQGSKSLSDAELLAIILRTGTRNKSAIELAQYIINKEKSDGIRWLSDVTIEELTQINGIGISKAAQIKAALELGQRISKSNVKKDKVTNPWDLYKYYMEEMRYLKKEKFKIILLNTKSEIITDLDISEGSLNSSIVHPREVFKEAIKRSANKMILMHNHPSGNPKPSKEDENVTNRLIECGKIIGIDVIDHIIIGDGTYFSFKENFIM